MHTLFESNKDDVLVNEVGYQLYDLVPSVKKGPLGRINVTFEQCIFNNNYGGKRLNTACYLISTYERNCILEIFTFFLITFRNSIALSISRVLKYAMAL